MRLEILEEGIQFSLQVGEIIFEYLPNYLGIENMLKPDPVPHFTSHKSRYCRSRHLVSNILREGSWTLDPFFFLTGC